MIISNRMGSDVVSYFHHFACTLHVGSVERKATLVALHWLRSFRLRLRVDFLPMKRPTFGALAPMDLGEHRQFSQVRCGIYSAC
jgi:hypothetical protein